MQTEYNKLQILCKSDFRVLLIVWAISAAYLIYFVDRGWIPHDEGSLAHMAERVLHGELPHRDFDEFYTGGLSFLYAAAFRIFGVKLITIRIVLYLFFLAFVPALYSIALRFASPLIAGAVTLLGVVWSVPNYFTGLPSWYNLFFATFGTLALIRHIETQQRRWLFIAGLCGGISFLAKIVGIYYVAAAFLFLTHREQVISSKESRRSALNFSWFFFLKGTVFLFFIASLIVLIQYRLRPMEVFHFILPAVAICGLLLWTECKEGQGSLLVRLRNLLSLLVPFGLGLVVPIVLFLIPYIITNSIADFYRWVFVLHKRLQYASTDFLPFLTVVASMPYALLLFFDFSRSHSRVLDKTFAVLVLMGLVVALSRSSNFYVYQFIWQSARQLAVVAVLAGCIILARASQATAWPIRRETLLLLVVMTGLLSLIQFPYPAPIYFCYIAPLVAVTLLGVVSLRDNAPKLFHLGILGFYFFFALLRTNTGYVTGPEYNFGLGMRYSPFQPKSVLDFDRGGIRVTDIHKNVYTQIVTLAREHRGSGYIYAAPECPEIYFLSGLRNPTRHIIDFLSDKETKPKEFAELLEAKGVEFVVINRDPYHSSKLDDNTVAVLQERFPQSVELGPFTARWRD